MRAVGCTGESPGQMTGGKKTGHWHLRTETKLKFPSPSVWPWRQGALWWLAAGKGLCVYVQSTIFPIKIEFMQVLRATL